MGEVEGREGPDPPRGPWTAAELELLLEVLPTALYRAAPDDPLRRLFVGGALDALVGANAERFRASSADWSALIHEDDLPGVREALEGGAAQAASGLEYRVRGPHGDDVWLRDRLIPVHRPGGDVVYHLGLVIDVTREKRERATFAEVVDQAPYGTILIDRNGSIELCNRALESMFGYAEGELEGQPVEVLVPAARRDEDAAWRERVFRERRVGRGARKPRELTGLHREGHELPIEVAMTSVESPSGLRILASVVDITERKKAREQLERANLELQRVARVDELTGLANRRRFEEQLEMEWARGRRGRTSLSLLMCDVDWFKAYNDRAGHLAGDAALQSVASVAEQSVRRPADLCARFGGEELVVLLPDTELAAARLLAERIRSRVEALRLPHPGLPPGRVLSLSIGVASVRPGASAAPRDLVEAADRQLYVAKNAGRNRVAAEQLTTASDQGRAGSSEAG